MAAQPKLSTEQWTEVRDRWELDPREGFKWIAEWIGEKFSVDMSPPGVSKTAKRDGWLKSPAIRAAANEVAFAATKVSPKVSKVSKSEEKPKKTKKTIIAETIETMPTDSADAVERDPDEFGVFAELTDQQEIFVREYLVDWNASAAAVRAGYSAKSAPTFGWHLLQNLKISHAIATLASARAKRMGIDGDELMRLWVAIVNFDANEISQLRRICCPYCWGEGNRRLHTPSTLEGEKKKHDKERALRLRISPTDDIGEFPEYTDDWYSKLKPPKEGCPECSGEGVVEVFFNDTRNLSPAARLMYCGVKVGKEGIEVIQLSKEKAMDSIARALSLFREKDVEVNVNLVNSAELSQIFEEKMRLSHERQALVLAERGIAGE